MGPWTIQELTSDQANCFRLVAVGEENDRFLIRCRGCRQTIETATADPVLRMDQHWAANPDCRPKSHSMPVAKVLQIRGDVSPRDVANWIDSHQDAVAVTVLGLAGKTYQVDGVVYLQRHQSLVIKVKDL